MSKNALAGETSPYLLQHANNPVHWQPWGEAAFEQARKENKPIFLSIGYSTCHWCHVMAHESFENPETAALMNEYFINIKVDREERPDVDRVYMAFVQATTGSGGWPMSVWLTPDLKPFFGGTYFPPKSQYGRPGFPEVLTQLGQMWREDQQAINAQGDKVLEGLKAMAAQSRSGDVTEDVGDRLSAEFRRSFDSEEGGFGGSPKFPRPSALEFLMRQPKDREMALQTLRAMAKGGIYDQIGGGFHRYSVDRYWHVPHFEKMLYDQAQLIVVYLEAYQATGERLFARIAEETLDYILRDMAHKEGGFYSAEDADSLLRQDSDEHAEGAFYVWTQAEILECLGDGEGTVFSDHYGVKADGNTPQGSDPMGEFTGKNILTHKGDGQRMEKACEKLFAVRETRPRPHRDDKILMGWNGLMLSALARGYQVLGNQAWLDAAKATVKFLNNEMYAPITGLLKRSWRNGAGSSDGFAEDYVFLIQGLLDLYEADFDTYNLKWAELLQYSLDEHFADPSGGYFSSAKNADDVIVRMKEDNDGAEPSANSVAALNLIKLWKITGREGYRKEAEALVKAFGGVLENSPMAMPLMVVASDELRADAAQIILAGGEKGESELLAEIHKRFLPGSVVIRAGGLREMADPAYLKGIESNSEICQAYLCVNNTCQLPVSTAAELGRLLDALED